MYFLIGIFFLLLIKIKSDCQFQLNTYDLSLGLAQCQNCQIVSDIKYCPIPCLNPPPVNGLIYNYNTFCYQYCGNGIVARIQGLNNCNDNLNTCIEGYQWSITDQKCIQNLACVEKIFDQNLLIYQCQNCSLASNVQDCQMISCSSSQYHSIKNRRCYEYCTDGKIAERYADCNSQNVLCVDGYQLNSQNKCEKSICPAKISTSDTFSAFLSQCPNCRITIQKMDCFYQPYCVSNSELLYYNYHYQLCMAYCGNGIIAFDKLSCPFSNLCIIGAQWSDSEQKCKTDFNICQIPDNYVQLSPNCSFVTNTNYCQNSCKSQQQQRNDLFFIQENYLI
ncbi:transmembrane protein, putative (macronuclear) [Tetrahymena thermophila SB210]|uniref:Transmembrane protein, putative n=1 Tax=Tetrahymena thermophila (strain SB210) TaxID=312017 RepID=Q23PS9_TETTS|nr:transmembrane protein, putative [Tetrahymena thermophila SB210]EAR98606.1 transmembrane protein, putative [Tetrahymena thermophila SB210]|eukprot:XP_001018851.1 transmembrane protein, putative [Tetrahymena thermophila SB210]